MDPYIVMYVEYCTYDTYMYIIHMYGVCTDYGIMYVHVHVRVPRR